MKIIKIYSSAISLLISFLITVYFPTQGNAQTKEPIKGVLGVQFGQSKAQILNNMKSKGYNQSIPAKNSPRFSKVKFGAFTNCEVAFSLTNDMLFQVIIILEPTLESKTIELYNGLIDEISKKYGPGDSYTSFKKPYEKGDGYETQAIKMGKAEYNTFWDDKNSGIINCYINSDLLVCIKYQDTILIEEAIKEKEKVNSTEY